MNIRLQTDKEGLGMLLGPLELAIMRTLWGAERVPMTNKEIRLALSRAEHELTLSTVSTTMHRLAEKQYVLETRGGGLFQYEARMTESELETWVVEHILAALRASWPEIMHGYDLGEMILDDC